MDKQNFGKLPGHKDSLMITNPSKTTKSAAAKSVRGSASKSVRGSGTKAWSGTERGMGKKGC